MANASQKENNDLYRKEAQRQAQDIIRVYNPTTEDWSEPWDENLHIVPAEKTYDVPFYLAKKYLKNMTTHLVYSFNERIVEEENKRRMSSGQLEMTPQERDKFEPKLRLKEVVYGDRKISVLADKKLEVINKKYLYPDSPVRLWQGLVSRFGFQGVVKDEESMSGTDLLVDNLFASYEGLMADEEKGAPLMDTPANGIDNAAVLNDKSYGELKHIAKEMGISAKRTDKKDELIQQIQGNG